MALFRTVMHLFFESSTQAFAMFTSHSRTNASHLTTGDVKKIGSVRSLYITTFVLSACFTYITNNCAAQTVAKTDTISAFAESGARQRNITKLSDIPDRLELALTESRCAYRHDGITLERPIILYRIASFKRSVLIVAPCFDVAGVYLYTFRDRNIEKSPISPIAFPCFFPDGTIRTTYYFSSWEPHENEMSSILCDDIHFYCGLYTYTFIDKLRNWPPSVAMKSYRIVENSKDALTQPGTLIWEAGKQFSLPR